MAKAQREKFERAFLLLARACTVGLAYVLASPIEGLTSSFVSIFMSLLLFDLMVAAPRPLLSVQEWKQFLEIVRPRVRSTAVTLLKGLAVGLFFGTLTVLGLPEMLGAVLTVGLAYVWATRTPYVISSYVAIMSALALFENMAMVAALEEADLPRDIVADLGPGSRAILYALQVVWTSLESGTGTFLGLMAGWVVGAVTGFITRRFLSRPYRSLQSQAYDLPIAKKPFDQVMPVGDSSVLFRERVQAGAPVAYQSLAQSQLRERYGATVLAVRRAGEDVVAPPGSFVLMPGDEVLVLVDAGQAAAVQDQLHAPPAPAGGPSKAPAPGAETPARAEPPASQTG
ncbi:MAG: hypothetical protein LOD91_01830 [Limnochordales bacterium]|nr:TrkA C-terminal domain-containing protein [Limnochordales bacterium]